MTALPCRETGNEVGRCVGFNRFRPSRRSPEQPGVMISAPGHLLESVPRATQSGVWSILGADQAGGNSPTGRKWPQSARPCA